MRNPPLLITTLSCAADLGAAGMAGGTAGAAASSVESDSTGMKHVSTVTMLVAAGAATFVLGQVRVPLVKRAGRHTVLLAELVWNPAVYFFLGGGTIAFRDLTSICSSKHR